MWHGTLHSRCVDLLITHVHKAIVDIILRPRCAIPPPSSRPIGRIACDRKFSEYYLRLLGILGDPICCLTLLAIEWSLCSERGRDGCSEEFWMACTTPSPWGSRPHLTHGTQGPPESLSQTASRSVYPFSYGSQMLCCTMHCQWGRKSPKVAHSPWYCVTPPEENRATAIGNMHERSRVWFGRYALGQTDRQTDRHAHTNIQTRSLQYFATAPAGEVKIMQLAEVALAEGDPETDMYTICLRYYWHAYT